MTTTTIAEDPHPGAGTLYVHNRTRPTPATWDEISKIREDPFYLSTPDVLLQEGIGEYTFIPGPDSILGKGKFSTVYKVIGPDGDYHTPLYPHHPLIAARLLREPTLLAQLPPHPNLIGVQGMKRTEGHFYLIEQYASHHAPLPAHPLPLSPSRAAYILDQLVSVIRDCLHKNRVCHRDIKGENVLVDQESGDILILDLGLATHFAASAPKLTTCCGSPAFHSPEIVTALAHPPGVITYYGPELDIWCIALTLLSLLLRVRFPLGPTHTHHSIMRSRVLDRLQELDELYPPSQPYLNIPNSQYLTKGAKEHEIREWRRVRRAMRDFLEIDGRKRIRKFGEYQVGQQVQRRVENFDLDGQMDTPREGAGVMKSTSFLPCEIKYTLPLYLDDRAEDDDPTVAPDMRPIVLDNPTGMKERKVLSYIRYLLRSAGIGYHCLHRSTDPSHTDANADDAGNSHIYQLVLAYPQTSPSISQIPSRDRSPQTQKQKQKQSGPDSKRSGSPGWVAALNPFKRPQPSRSVSVPSKPKSRAASKDRSASGKQAVPPSPGQASGTDTGTGTGTGGKKRWLRTWIRIQIIDEGHSFSPPSSSHSHDFSHHGHGHGHGNGTGTPGLTSRSSSRTRIETLTPMLTGHLLPDMHGLSISSAFANPNTGTGTKQRRPSPSPRRKTTSDRYNNGNGCKPSPLSRQVSPEPTFSRASSSSGRTRVSQSTVASHHHHRRSRVVIHSSDWRCYPAIKAALDIKHQHQSQHAYSPGMAKAERYRDRGSSEEISPIIIQTPQNQSPNHEVEEEERGRPRSKESVPTLETIQARRGADTVQADHEDKEMQVGVTVVEENKRRESRNRKTKTGFWSLFASVDSHSISHRSISMPPTREALT